MSLVESFKHFLGFSEESGEYGFEHPVPVKKPAPLTSVKPQIRESKIVDFQAPPRKVSPKKALESLSQNMGIVITEPRSYEEDSRLISGYLKDGHVVVINLKYLDAPTGKRLVDFVCGTIYAFEGYVKKLGGNIFLCTPGSINVVDNQQEDVIFNDEQEYYPQEASREVREVKYA